MKTKLLMLCTAFFVQYFSGQCYIEGKSQLSVGETSTYSIANNTANCEECHQWKVIDNNTSIRSDSLKSSIQLKGISNGTSTITLSGTSAKGPFQCSKTINVVPVTPANITTENPKCDIKTANFTEQRNGEMLILTPEIRKESFFYTWTLKSGAEAIIKKAQNQELVLSKEESANVTEIQLRIQSNKCMRTVNKTYPAGF